MKVAIVSAYGECEGNSEYTRALEKEFIRQGHDVTIFRLPFDLFITNAKNPNDMADKLIDEMSAKLHEFDHVNIQYESILFGAIPYKRYRRINKILENCPKGKFSVTIHRLNIKNYSSLRKYRYALKKFFSMGKKVNETIQHLKMLDIIVERGGKLIVHTQRDKLALQGINKNLRIEMFPLSYNTLEELNELKNNFSKADYIAEKGISIPEDSKVISIIASMTHQKDYFTVIKSLKYLPENYHLFIYGGQHRLEFQAFPKGLPMLVELQQCIEQTGVANRVHFMGFQPRIEDMTKAHLYSDCVVVSYTEVGESGSAAASTALELCENLIMSRNCCSDELNVFAKDAFYTFDMGNYMELAEKIKTLPDKNRVHACRKEFLEKYNVTENVKMYLR